MGNDKTGFRKWEPWLPGRAGTAPVAASPAAAGQPWVATLVTGTNQKPEPRRGDSIQSAWRIAVAPTEPGRNRAEQDWLEAQHEGTVWRL